MKRTICLLLCLLFIMILSVGCENKPDIDELRKEVCMLTSECCPEIHWRITTNPPHYFSSDFDDYSIKLSDSQDTFDRTKYKYTFNGAEYTLRYFKIGVEYPKYHAVPGAQYTVRTTDSNGIDTSISFMHDTGEVVKFDVNKSRDAAPPVERQIAKLIAVSRSIVT